MLELDLLLLPFFDEVYANLTSDQQQTFEKLLEQDDPDLLQWFSRKASPVDPEMDALIKIILERVQP